LLIRVVIGPIGPIGLDLTGHQPVTLRAPASLIGPVLPAGPAVAPVAEWRLVSHSRTREALPWRAFPRVADGIAEWVIKQAVAHSCDVVVIGARLPQELAVGLGIQLGQRPSSWPWRMYPAIYDHGQLVIPDLQLGGEAVPPQRTP
jgi:hypothetical protein